MAYIAILNQVDVLFAHSDYQPVIDEINARYPNEDWIPNPNDITKTDIPVIIRNSKGNELVVTWFDNSYC